MPVKQTTLNSNDRDRSNRHERRSEQRRRSRGQAFALFVVRPSLQSVRVSIWDASPSGISFLHDAPLKPKTALALQLKGGKPGVSWVRTARVIHAIPYEGKWVIGCQVSPPFSEIELEGL